MRYRIPLALGAVLGALCLLGGLTAADAAFPGQNGRISFSSIAGGSGDLFSIAPAQPGAWQRLTTDPADDAQSAWSPDGARVAFRSRRDGHYEVYVMNADGSGQARLTNTPAPMFSTQPSWSPDGRRLLTRSSRSGNPEVWLMNSDGTSPAQITDNPADERYPGFSPDASQITFISDRDGDFEIYVMNADGSNVRQLTENAVLDTGPAWSPDGGQIAFASERDGNLEVYLMNADGSSQHPLSLSPAEDIGPAFSPDGTRIAFTSARDGNLEIYVMNRDGSSPTRLTNSPNIEQSPDWQPLAPGAGQPPSAPTTARDRKAPRLTLRLRKRQRALRRGSVVVRASCDEACFVVSSGKLRRSAGGSFKLKRARRSLAAGVTGTLRLRVPKRAARALSASARKRKVVARIKITARDAPANTRSLARRVRITG